MSVPPTKHVNILGTRGIPAAHGGFETFAEYLALFLQARGWSVTVYCQSEDGLDHPDDEWCGIERITFGTKRDGPVGTMEFDLKCVRDVIKRPGVDLVLGYNTAIFNILERLWGRKVLMNMDGIEWKRAKWSFPAKVWFFLNELIGANICNVPIADHPEIAKHVQRRTFKKPVMIPYGAEEITEAPVEPIEAMGLSSGKYLVSIARIEPENSILEIIQAMNIQNTDLKCVILGKINKDNRYHNEVVDSAGPNVIFPGAIYDKDVVSALRFHSRAYFHGHQVGGTNPSLVEALGAGNAVIAHDNKFNRWTTGGQQFYFGDVAECVKMIEAVASNDAALDAARQSSREQFKERFVWDDVLKQYEDVIETML